MGSCRVLRSNWLDGEKCEQSPSVVNMYPTSIASAGAAVLFLFAGGPAEGSPVPTNTVWPRPVIVPPAAVVTGVQNPVILLAGRWQITARPPDGFWSNSVDTTQWAEVVTPGQADRQGIRPAQRNPYVYKTRIAVPADYAGKRVILRFEGVTGTAKAWINGVAIGEHHGGFTVWDQDISDLVVPGSEVYLYRYCTLAKAREQIVPCAWRIPPQAAIGSAKSPRRWDRQV